MPEDFLPERDERSWLVDKPPGGLTPECWWRGRGESFRAEVALARSAGRPRANAVRDLWRTRSSGDTPILLVVRYTDGSSTKAATCGPVGEQPPIRWDLELEQTARLAAAVLEEPDGHAAVRLMLESLSEVDDALPGVRNDGLLALHDLSDGVPNRPDWEDACERALPLLGRSGRELVTGLGFGTESADALSVELLVDERRRALAVFLDDREDFDRAEPRFGNKSPVTHALTVAQRRGLSWVVLTRGRQIRIYSVNPDIGVGRRGRALTSFGLDLALLPAERAGYLDLVFSPRALDEGGTLEELLESSSRFAADLGARLRDRVYYDAVPTLATAVARHITTGAATEQELAAAYERTLVILFRLLFVAYGEDRGLLPYETNELYREHSLKRLAVELAERRSREELVFDRTHVDLWERVRALFRAVERGHTEWGVPPYGGSLFSADPTISPEGALIDALELTNAEIGPALAAMLVDLTREGLPGPVDFRSLSVREFGTIYEGLLESELSVAPSDLSLDKKGTFVPAQAGAEPVVAKGEIYFHDRSGARKATGSYFTKPFAVEHLLDRALMPALDAHLERVAVLIEEGDEAGATTAFFDFRCADLAMGSAHFLVAAVDRIEARFSGFLAEHRIPGVDRELDELRTAAHTALGPIAAGPIETSSLLRRLIARRCIYGVDLNRIAVELARLALWIHTFVPGLPLSFLDRNLVEGNSLTGVATIDEAIEALDPTHGEQMSVLRDPLMEFLGRAEVHLRRLATIADATSADVTEARVAAAAAEEALAPLRLALDLVVAHRLGKSTLPSSIDERTLAAHPHAATATELAETLQCHHFPVRFPEVFLRKRPGFDCLIGNPPWEKLQVERHAFWALRYPGLRAMGAGAMEEEITRLEALRPDLVDLHRVEVDGVVALRQLLLRGPYPGLGSSHPDLYKAFAWRYWHLLRDAGISGVVLPRVSVGAAGTADWREAVLASGAFRDVTMLVNRRGWVFDDVHQQFTIVLTAIEKGTSSSAIRLLGPFSSIEEYEGAREPIEFPVATLVKLPELVLPLIASQMDADLLAALREAPSLADHDEDWWARSVQGDLNSTAGKEFFDLDVTAHEWPVLKGASFELWNPDTGERYGSIEPSIAKRELSTRRKSSSRRAGSAFAHFANAWLVNEDTLPCLNPRIAYRRIARATDTRTLIPVLLPPKVVLVDTAPYLLFSPGATAAETAFVLGVMASIPVDWFVRRIAEAHVDAFVINALPVPRRCAQEVRERIEQIAGRLAAVDEQYADWAAAVGVPVGSVTTPEEKEDLIAELDACVARLYGLDERQLRHVFETFHPTWDYGARLDRVLEYFRAPAAVESVA